MQPLSSLTPHWPVRPVAHDDVVIVGGPAFPEGLFVDDDDSSTHCIGANQPDGVRYMLPFTIKGSDEPGPGRLPAGLRPIRKKEGGEPAFPYCSLPLELSSVDPDLFTYRWGRSP